MNRIQIIGNLGRDPELKYLPSGQAVCNFSVAVNEVYYTGDGNNREKHEKTYWFRVAAWGNMGENASKYLSKGRQVLVEGRATSSAWLDKNGQARSQIEINAQNIQYLGGGNGSSSNGQSEFAPPQESMDDIPF